MKVRTRFAPSPTGYMHVGNFRTGLFAWLTARHSGGKFILRFEDTDKKREVKGAAEHLLQCFKQLGIDYDEGPDKGGPYAPYVQSQRLENYRQWAQMLIDSDRAYADPYTAEEVQEFRRRAEESRKPFLYRDNRPKNPPAWDGTRPLRFRSEPKAYSWHDAVMGDLSTGPEVIDDFVLIKSDGYPTYNFAHIIDDAEMEISHVIRGQEFIPSVPGYLNLYEALGLKPPIMATMPHVLAPSGSKKLSKRDGAKDILDYIKDGYLPDALINFVASLGWNDGTEQEIFTRQELVEKFSLEHVQKSGARFDEKRLEWMNGYYIRQLGINELVKHAESFWGEEAKRSDGEYRQAVLELVQERLKHFSELPALTSFFFKEPETDNALELINRPVDKQLSAITREEVIRYLEAARGQIEESNFTEEDIASRLNQLLKDLSTKPGVLFALIRIAVTASSSSPQLFGTLRVLGKKRSLERIDKLLAVLR